MLTISIILVFIGCVLAWLFWGYSVGFYMWTGFTLIVILRLL